jgi:hypothetical protein
MTGTRPRPPSTIVLDGGWRTTREAEHAVTAAAARLRFAPVTACTHFATTPRRVVVTLQLAGPVPPGLTASRADPAGLPPGRAFVFGGSDRLSGVMPVADVLATSAIDEVRLLGGGPVHAGTELDTQGFVRPGYEGGRLVLLARPARGGRLVPFEQPNPTPCCADH